MFLKPSGGEGKKVILNLVSHQISNRHGRPPEALKKSKYCNIVCRWVCRSFTPTIIPIVMCNATQGGGKRHRLQKTMKKREKQDERNTILFN